MLVPRREALGLCSCVCRRRRRSMPGNPWTAGPFSHPPSLNHGSRSPHNSLTQIEANAFISRQFHFSQHNSSDNLLGHSPMARSAPTTSQQAATVSPSPPDKGPVWGVDSNTAGGGVWAQTSAKRDKLNELLTELNADGVDTGAKGMETLDDAADEQEKLDLALADGIKFVAKFADDGMKDNTRGKDSLKEVEIVAARNEASLVADSTVKQMFQLLESASSLEEWERPKFEATMDEVIRILSTGLLPNPKVEKPVAGSLNTAHPFCYLREFVESQNSTSSCDVPDDDGAVEQKVRFLEAIVSNAFSSSTKIYRALLLRAAAQTLLENWDMLTTATSGDIDRAAVAKTAAEFLPQRQSVNAKNVKTVFDAYAKEGSGEWVQSWWSLIDADGDGLIDEEEMNNCIDLAMKPVHLALSDMVHMSLGVCPSRTTGLGADKANAWFLGGTDMTDIDTNPSPTNVNIKLSWRNRRREMEARKILTKTFQATLARHFRDQVETSHRLRCIYAWADKSHQNNKIDSILVDASEEWGAASSIVGRKRYVELEPKISYPEFRKEQARHFPHLDKIGEEVAMSFKEDLWVLQGKGRQNKELKRDCFLFLLGVSLVDAVILML
ncbi:hypothetical protein ACHAWF_018871 [Thalassiosira exigua]